MNGLFLHTSNQLETLATELAGLVAEPLDSPFTPEIVMVQSLGMRRWISLQLADRLGICLNCQFPFPRAFLNDTLRRLVAEMAPEEAFSVDLMTWKIHRLLPTLLERVEFASVSHYAADHDAMKLYQLSSRLAQLFDQYLVYRPEMLLGWERGDPAIGETEAWQAVLWRELNSERQVHFAAVLQRLAAGIPEDSQLPSRISIFGISSLPPAQMQIFLHLAALRPVHLFSLAPSREYHGDDLTPKQRVRRGLGSSGEGNPLLTSLGKLNTQFTNLLMEADERAGHRIVDASENYSEPGSASLLHVIQEDILNAHNRAAAIGDGDALERLHVAPEDRSLQVHVCHSPMREVEVLYDQLLALFATDRSLQPRDIVVMMPDIESYAPLISAVFGYPEEASLRIPFSIADRQPRSDSPTIGTFLSILELPGTRCTAPQIFALLQSPPFRRKFWFNDEELGRIRLWIHESGIRWGIDAADRSDLGVPEFTENTWRHGLDRLLLGYAMMGSNRTTFEGILPQDDVEGSGAELLGRMVSALEGLFSVTRALTAPRALSEWPAALKSAVDQFFGNDPDAAPLDRHDMSDAPSSLELHDVQELRTAVDKLSAVALEAGPDQLVEFAAIREHVTGMLGEAEQRGGFLTGCVTFCALKPMRSIPARVIWLMGMNDNAFPRRPQPPQFDLMSAAPKPGDRSVRDDDRYLFLEALLSARDRLCISHVGRSLVDHEKIPPSVVVSELLDYLDPCFHFPAPAKTARESLVFEHRLHQFSRTYFEPAGRLFSYSAANCAAALSDSTAQSIARLEPGFLDHPLEEPPPEARNVELARLLTCFENPAAFFLRERLGIRLSRAEKTLEESEPLELDALGRYGVRKELLDLQLAKGMSPGQSAFSARALLPSGSMGVQYYETFKRGVEALHGSLLERLGTTVRDEPQSIDLRLGSFSLTGRIDAVYQGKLAFFRPANLKVKDRIQAWIQHLVWCVSRSGPPSTLLVGDDETVEFSSLSQEDSQAQLQALLEIYWRAMQKPLPFFRETSFEFTKPQGASAKRTPMERALEKWRGNTRAPGDKDDPACGICFGGHNPLNGEFEELATAVFGPMHASTVPQESTKKGRKG